MSRKLFNSPVAVALTILLVCSCGETYGQTHFWLSANNASGGVTPVAPEIEAALGQPTTISLWARPTATLENFSLNIVSTSETVLQFDSVEVENAVGDGSDRFEFVFDTLNGLVVEEGFCTHDALDFDTKPTRAIWDIRGFTFDSANASGLAGEAMGTQLATITLTGLELGTTNLYLQIGEIGVNEVGSTTLETNVSFGGDEALLNAGLNRCVNSAASDATISVVETLSLVETLLGDFNDDGLVDAADIDLLSIEERAGTDTAKFDVTGDTLVDQSDRSSWVTDIKGTVFGDANFDKKVSFTDFLLLSSSFGRAGGWAAGDFDGDAAIGFPDFLILSDAFGTVVAANSHSTTAVPEPTALPLACVAMLWLVGLRGRNRTEG